MELLFPGNRPAQLEILLEMEEKRFRDALKADEELEVLKAIRLRIRLIKEQLVLARQNAADHSSISLN